jgi:rhodanese-related sulfurtransferase
MPNSVRVHYIKPEELRTMMGASNGSECDLVDVRREDEFRNGHIQGAHLIPIDSLESRTSELDRSKTTVLYCKSGKRCLRGAQILTDKGWEEVYVLEGGYDRYRSSP